MPIYPQPLPAELRAAIRQIGQPTALSMIMDGGGTQYPMVVIVDDHDRAVTWAKTPGLKLGALLIAVYSEYGSVLGVEIEILDQPDSSMRAYTTLNPANNGDRGMFKLLAKSDHLAVGFADMTGMLQGAKLIGWYGEQHQDVADFTLLAIDHNKAIKKDGKFDYALAREAFDEHYQKERGRA